MPITTLIVDDTVTYRKILSEVVAGFPQLQVVDTAPSGALALKKMERTPIQLVLLDIHMPDMDGVETLRRIRAQFPATLVVMVSGISTRSAETTIKALELGALDFIRKPEAGTPQTNIAALRNDIRPLIRMIESRLEIAALVSTKATPPLSPVRLAQPSNMRHSIPARFGIVAIGVSTGGPEALGRVLPLLPADLAAPVVIVQHMPPLFTKSLADSLSRKSKLRIVEATEGDVISAGTAYLAPGGRHMTVRQESGVLKVALNDGPPENSCRPAVDVLFRSVADSCGDKGVLAVVLTGMGSDGTNGLRALKRKSCFAITQSESTCVVYGMPRSVDEAGLSDRSAPLDSIADEIVKMVGVRLPGR